MLQGNIDKNTSPYLIGKLDKTQILPGNAEDVIQAETAPNPNLRWEKTQNINAGIDVSVLNRAIALTVDYYYRRSTDLIGMRMLPLETGFSSTTINWASMENQCVELSIATRNIYTHDFLWTTNINIGYNDNKVLQETVAENATYGSNGCTLAEIVVPADTLAIRLDLLPDVQNEPDEVILAPIEFVVDKVDRENNKIFLTCNKTQIVL